MRTYNDDRSPAGSIIILAEDIYKQYVIEIHSKYQRNLTPIDAHFMSF